LLLLLLLLHRHPAVLLLQQLPLQLLLSCEVDAIERKGSAHRSSAQTKIVRWTYSSQVVQGSAVQINTAHVEKVEGASTAIAINVTWTDAAIR
jgi:hypothetical protein